jgi:AcrR family transcriptional regulator
VREELARAAELLFDERGFDAVTVDEIAEAAGVSPRSFFRYFGCKEAVLFPDQEPLLETVRAEIASQTRGTPPLEVLRAAISALARATRDDEPQALRRARMAESGAALTEYQQTVLLPLWEGAIAEALSEHLGVDANVDMRPRLLAGVGIAVMTAVGQVWVASGGAAEVDSLLAEGFDLLARMA